MFICDITKLLKCNVTKAHFRRGNELAHECQLKFANISWDKLLVIPDHVRM